LTGIFNRRYLDHRLAEEVARAQRYDLPLSILMLDIDHFKQINDRYGHQAGDQVLISLGEVVARELRESDILARYGGEEFLVMALNIHLLGATYVAERICKRIESHSFILPNDPSGISVTVSIGVASLGNGVDDREKLVQVADENLYRAKREGRNRVIVGTPEVIGTKIRAAPSTTLK
jgi:diguanylate cyclase (GGDEF)-like protein